MGGLVAVGVIDETGRLETIVGRTNALPPVFKNSAFIGGDFSKLEEYLEYFRHNRLDEGYGPSDHVPSEYGYVLFDLKDRAIISAQDYTSIGTLSGPQITNDDAARIICSRISYNADGESVTTSVGPYASVTEFDADLANDPRGGVESYSDILDEIIALAPSDIDRSGDGTSIIARMFDSLTEEKRTEIAGRLEKSRAVDEFASTMFTYEIDYGNWLIVDGRRNSGDLSAVLGYITERVDLSGDELEGWNTYLSSMQADDEIEEPAIAPGA